MCRPPPPRGPSCIICRGTLCREPSWLHTPALRLFNRMLWLSDYIHRPSSSSGVYLCSVHRDLCIVFFWVFHAGWASALKPCNRLTEAYDCHNFCSWHSRVYFTPCVIRVLSGGRGDGQVIDSVLYKQINRLIQSIALFTVEGQYSILLLLISWMFIGFIHCLSITAMNTCYKGGEPSPFYAASTYNFALLFNFVFGYNTCIPTLLFTVHLIFKMHAQFDDYSGFVPSGCMHSSAYGLCVFPQLYK